MADEALQAEIEALAREFAVKVTRLVAGAIVREVEAAVAPGAARGLRAAAPEVAPRRPRRLGAGAVERWVPDRRARRVPRFVIEATGLATKREIVERFGEHALFEKGQPAPPPLRAAGGRNGDAG